METVLQGYMTKAGHTDMYSVFMELEFAGEWDATPSKAVAVIAGLYPLYSRILRLCRNCVLPIERLRTALCNLDNRMSIFQARFFPKGGFPDKRPTVEVARMISDLIQVGADMLRDLKTDSGRYHRSMVGLRTETTKKLDVLIGMISLDISHQMKATAYLNQHSYVDATGCRMDVFDRALSGELGRPPHQGENKYCDKDCDKSHDMIKPDNSLHDLTWDKYCDTFESHQGETRFVSMLSDEDVGEEIRDTQTAAVDAGSVGTDEVVEPEPAGVDTAHASRSLTAESVLPVKPHWERPRRNGKWIAKKEAKPQLQQTLPWSVWPPHWPKPPSVIPYGHHHNNQAKAKNKPEKKKGSNARSKLVAYGKLVRRVSDARVTRKLDQEVVERKRKHCEAAYKRQLTATVGNRKAARKAYVKAGREFDLILKGSVSV